MQTKAIITDEYISVMQTMAVAEINIIEGQIWWFNRLFVNASLRRQGIAKNLMTELCKILDNLERLQSARRRINARAQKYI